MLLINVQVHSNVHIVELLRRRTYVHYNNTNFSLANIDSDNSADVERRLVLKTISQPVH